MNGLVINAECTSSVAPDNVTSGATAVVSGAGAVVGAGVVGGAGDTVVGAGGVVVAGVNAVVATADEVGLVVSSSSPHAASIATVAASTVNAGATRQSTDRRLDMPIS